MAAVHFPRLVFKYPFDEAAAYDAGARGYLAYSSVELGNGTRYPVVFYDPIRLQQDLEVEAREGRAFIAEPGMIVVPGSDPGSHASCDRSPVSGRILRFAEERAGTGP